MVMTLPLLLIAPSVDFYTGGPQRGSTKMCCMTVPWPGSAVGCTTTLSLAWGTFGGRWTDEEARARPCLAKWYSPWVAGDVERWREG